MRRARSRGTAERTDVDLTPMLDVVFILLIFFIVSASFVREVGLDLPARDTASPIRSMAEVGNILVEVTGGEALLIDREPVARDALAARLARLRAERPQGALVIAADGRSRNGLLVEIMDRGRQAGVERIALAAEGPSGEAR